MVKVTVAFNCTENRNQFIIYEQYFLNESYEIYLKNNIAWLFVSVLYLSFFSRSKVELVLSFFNLFFIVNESEF
jgi:hypothetical protein